MIESLIAFDRDRALLDLGLCLFVASLTQFGGVLRRHRKRPSFTSAILSLLSLLTVFIIVALLLEKLLHKVLR